MDYQLVPARWTAVFPESCCSLSQLQLRGYFRSQIEEMLPHFDLLFGACRLHPHPHSADVTGQLTAHWSVDMQLQEVKEEIYCPAGDRNMNNLWLFFFSFCCTSVFVFIVLLLVVVWWVIALLFYPSIWPFIVVLIQCDLNSLFLLLLCGPQEELMGIRIKNKVNWMSLGFGHLNTTDLQLTHALNK